MTDQAHNHVNQYIDAVMYRSHISWLDAAYATVAVQCIGSTQWIVNDSKAVVKDVSAILLAALLFLNHQR